MEFRQLVQIANESIQDFSSCVMTLANICDWANHDEQIVCGIIIFGAAHSGGIQPVPRQSHILRTGY